MRKAIALAVKQMREGSRLTYPPSDDSLLTEEEERAVGALNLEPAARSGLRKIIRAAASAPLFHLFCLFDGVGHPELTDGIAWGPIHLEAGGDETRAMMHDEFYDSFWKYRERTGGGSGGASGAPT